MKSKLIRVCPGQGKPPTLRVVAEVYTPSFAIHPDINHAGFYVITHIRSGLCLPHRFTKKRHAIAVAALMEDGYDWDFDSGCPIGADKYFKKQVKRIEASD